ncbi:MAG: L,D-transpeptidase family protein [Gammaproteobacteria bacterium]|nr:L,D-transpeptidase family protein [Gammaproteobacteria bacterium]
MNAKIICSFFAMLATLSAWVPLGAAAVNLPGEDDALVGESQTTVARYQDTLSDIARLHGLGFDEIRDANPGVDTWLPGEGTRVVLPTRHILPDAPRDGIVINVAEKRLYYYPPTRAGEQPRIVTYPVSIGRGDWQTPLIATSILSKVKDPTWYPPESVRKEHAANGDPLPSAVPPGPNNPLGGFAMRLGLPSYLIHGTNKPFGIGMQVTHGCIRLYPEEIEALFNAVPVGTPVRIVNQTYKAGWHQGELYLEVHAPLSDGTDPAPAQNLTPVVAQVIAATEGRPGYEIDWARVRAIVSEQAGVPIAVGRGEEPPAPPASVAQTETPDQSQAQ